MTEPAFNKVVIFGVGLIGGSFALALRKAEAVGEVVGFGRTKATLKKALEADIIDRIGDDVESEVSDADLVLLAVPVAQMADIFAQIAPHLGKDTLVTDGGSTKSDVVAAARANLGDKIGQFVPAHPIAGAEASGPAAAQEDLYLGKKVVLTPLQENDNDMLIRACAAWEACGAQIERLSPEQHDDVFAAVSHLPHMLAFALVHDLAQRDNHKLLLSFAASGFRDFTRIAASSPEMWRDICLANRDALLREMRQYADELFAMYEALESRDADRLEEIFRQASEVRGDWSPKQ